MSALKSLNLEGIADLIKSGKAKNIIVMTGAGISVSAGQNKNGISLQK